MCYSIKQASLGNTGNYHRKNCAYPYSLAEWLPHHSKPTLPSAQITVFVGQQTLTSAKGTGHDAEISYHSAPSLSSASQTVKFPGCTRGEWTTLYDGGISERFRETRGPTSSFCLASDVCL